MVTQPRTLRRPMNTGCNMITEETRKKLAELVERFRQNADSYKAPSYNETQARQEFINPFFEILGWDVQNKAGYAEQYKDCVHEDSIMVGVSLKAPDYSFRIGGQRKFFLEAKKPSVNIKDDINPALQLRRYAWSAKLALSIVTDFEELAVYDCRVKPNPNDKVSDGRIAYYTYDQYIAKFDEIYGIFSKEAVLKGSFDRYISSPKIKKGTAEVDKEFLGEIETWRVSLAKNLAIRNPALTVDELNFAVQHTLDRIIFLRICEDRGIENYGQLQSLLNGRNIYERLLSLFNKADDKYNSGLFDFKSDTLSHSLAIDDAVLKETIENLYYPKSPYVFSVISVDILGSVYERFLGKVIRLTAGHQAKVEDKPEVKKAGGVYYTPAYIVEYIVKNTVGQLVDDKTPAEISKLRIIDPACGSGSFLIGAYQYLLNHHITWYMENTPEKFAKGKNPAVYHGQGGWRLTTYEKKKILLNNVYGVDIDRQAVEVTKLSLLLKVLEDENGETIGKASIGLLRERVLPNLEDNIKCGNSLIGPDFYNQMSLGIDNDDIRRINVFDWNDEKKGFGRIMKAGGFDAVVGNPPYVRIQAMKEWAPLEVEEYKRRYRAASKGNYDIYTVFVEKGLSLLNKKGLLGYILPNKFFQAQYGEPLREIISMGCNLSSVVDFGDKQVFDGATTYTCLLFLNRHKVDKLDYMRIHDLNLWQVVEKVTSEDNSEVYERGDISCTTLTAEPWNFVVGKNRKFFEKMSKIPVKLGDIAEIFVGLQTSADDIFIMHLVEDMGEFLRLKSKSLDREWVFEKDLLFPIVSGTDVKGYKMLPERQYVLFPYEVKDNVVRLLDLEFIIKTFSKTAAYLLENKDRLQSREKNKMKGSNWYGYIYLKNMSKQSKIKLCVPRLVEKLHTGFDFNGTHFLDNVDVNGITLRKDYEALNLKYLLALLNSKFMAWFFPLISVPFRGGWLSANRQFIERLPIRTIDFSKKSEKAAHDRVVSLVELMLSLNKRLAEAKTPHDKELLERQIKATDNQIDQLVYELYGLTEEEIRIVEGRI